MMKTVIKTSNLTNNLFVALEDLARNLARTLSRTKQRSRNQVRSLSFTDLDASVVNIWVTKASTPFEQRASDEKIWNTFKEVASNQKLNIDLVSREGSELYEVSFDDNSETLVSYVDALTLAVRPNLEKNDTFYKDLTAFVNTIPRTADADTRINILQTAVALVQSAGITLREMYLSHDSKRIVKDLTYRLNRIGITNEHLEQAIDGNEVTIQAESEAEHIEINVRVEQPEVAEAEAEVEVEKFDKTEVVETEVVEAEVEVEQTEEETKTTQERLTALLEALANISAKPQMGKDRKVLIRKLRKAGDLSTPENVHRMKNLIDKLDLSLAELVNYGRMVDAAINNVAIVNSSYSDSDFEEFEPTKEPTSIVVTDEASNAKEVQETLEEIETEIDSLLVDSEDALQVAKSMGADIDDDLGLDTDEMFADSDEDEDDDDFLSFDEEDEDEATEEETFEDPAEIADAEDKKFKVFCKKYDNTSDLPLRRILATKTGTPVIKLRSLNRTEVLRRLFAELED